MPITLQTNYAPITVAATTYRATFTSTHVMGVFGIDTTKFVTTLIFEYSGSVATKALDCYGKASNYNPGVWTTYNGASIPYISGGYAFGRASWELAATGTLGFISNTLGVTNKSNGTSSYYKVDSTRSEWATGWR